MVDTLPDPEIEAVELIEELLDLTEHAAEAGDELPADWTPTSPTFVLVACDLVASEGTCPVYADCTIRCTVYARGRRRAKRIALDLQALLIDRGSVAPFARHRPLTGPLLTRDPSLNANVASITVRSTLRTVPLVLPGS